MGPRAHYASLNLLHQLKGHSFLRGLGELEEPTAAFSDDRKGITQFGFDLPTLQCCMVHVAGLLPALLPALCLTTTAGSCQSSQDTPNLQSAAQLSDHLPGVFKGPGDGTLKF